MPDRLCIECFNTLDDEYELEDRCLGCEEGQPETWPWEDWNDFIEVDAETLEALGESEEDARWPASS